MSTCTKAHQEGHLVCSWCSFIATKTEIVVLRSRSLSLLFTSSLKSELCACVDSPSRTTEYPCAEQEEGDKFKWGVERVPDSRHNEGGNHESRDSEGEGSEDRESRQGFGRVKERSDASKTWALKPQGLQKGGCRAPQSQTALSLSLRCVVKERPQSIATSIHWTACITSVGHNMFGELRTSPPFHGSRSYRETKMKNASCQEGGLKVTRRHKPASFCWAMWGRNITHPNLPRTL